MADDVMVTTSDGNGSRDQQVKILNKLNEAILLNKLEYIEHMMSAHVVLEHLKYKCKKCDAAFFLRRNFHDHLVSHAVQEKRKRFASYYENIAKTYNHNLPENFIKHLTSAHVVLEIVPETMITSEIVSNQRDRYRIKNTNGSRFIKRHLCKECGEMFVKKTTLDAHSAIHDPYPYICDCGIGFYKKSDLGQHRTLLHLEEVKKELETKPTTRQQRDLISDIWVPNVIYINKERASNGYTPSNKGPRLKAELSFKTKKKRIRSSGSIQESYDCNLCGSKFVQNCRLTVHMKNVHGNKDFSCSYCGKSFTVYHNMKNHERIHTGLKPFLCSFCQKGFCDPSARLRHERIHTGIKPYICKFCGKSFSDASGRYYHEKRHTKDRKFPCEICGKNFYIPYYRDKHITAVHGGNSLIKKFECHLCSKKFLMKNYLFIHMKTHSTDKRFECHYCGHKTKFKANLIQHIDSLHLKLLLRRQCDFCPFKTKHRYVLIKHINAVHKSKKNGLQKQKCKTVPKSKSGLAKHFTQSKKPLDCIFCAEKFKTKATLVEHYDKMHSDQKRFECNDCGMKHISKHYLRLHIFNEHMELLYCNLCNKKFFSDTDLKRHKLKPCL